MIMEDIKMGISKKMRRKLKANRDKQFILGHNLGISSGDSVGTISSNVSDAEGWLAKELGVGGFCDYCGKKASHLGSGGIYGESEPDAVKVNFEDGLRSPVLVHEDCMDNWDRKMRGLG